MVFNGSEMVRYNSLANAIEFSNNQGMTWFKRSGCSGMGKVRALTMHKGEILLCSDRGVYFSQSGGRSWFMRAPGERDFVDMQSMGDKVIAVTGDNKTYVSDNGFCWFRRH